MRIASLVLGIIGGVLAIVFAIIFFLGGALSGILVSTVDSGMDALASQMAAEGWEVQDNPEASKALDSANKATASLWLIGAASLLGAVLGIVGGALAKKKGMVAGILMVVAAIAVAVSFVLAMALPGVSVITAIIATALFAIGGALAFIPQKAPQKAAA